MRVLRPFVVAIALGCLGLLGSACSSSPPAVSKADVEKQVTDQLAAQTGTTPDSVTCPGDLAATVGTSMRCTLAKGGSTIGVTVAVTSVDNDTAKFSIKVDDAPAATTTSTP
jgi:hypothetical protein